MHAGHGVVLTAEPVQAPRTPASDALAEKARAKIKQDQDLAFARGVKQGRADERKEILASAGQRSLDELAMLPAIQQAHAHTLLDMRKQFEREEAKHGAHRWWKGFAVGGLVWGIIAGAATYAVIDNGQKAAFDAATDATARGVIVDRASRAAEQPTAVPASE